jgi:putative ABC transport system ATP-binding protein
MSKPQIEIRRLSKIFRSGNASLTVLDRVDLAVEAGESIAILGPSGSGKSTLLALVAGLDRPTSGEVFLEDQPIHELSEDALAILRRHRIGFVFQSFQLLSNMTAHENVRLPMELLGIAEAEPRAHELLEMVGLGDRGHHYPSQLSGGEQQRVALARAFANRPPILLADEPTGNLDRQTGRRVLEVMGDLRRHFRSTLILVTHDTAVASLTDRRLTLVEGKLIAAGEDHSELLDSSS